jgi:sortase A
VEPSAVWVLDPVPGKAGQPPTRQLITLTTCNPRWASTQRMILFGHLVGTQPTTEGKPLALKKDH